MNNKKNLLQFTIFSVTFSFILGTLLHFTYELSGNNPFVGLFSAVNESVWEHLKLVFFPMAITTIIGSFYFKETFPNYICHRLFGVIIAFAFIVIFFYTYTGILGTNLAILNIASFFISILLGEWISYIHIQKNICFFPKICNASFCFICFYIILFCFILFTFFPIQISFFQDPITKSFGISSF